MTTTAKYQVIIDAVTKGMKIAFSDLEKLETTTSKVDSANKKASKSSADLFNKQDKGIIGTANTTRSFSKLANTIGSGSNGLVGAYAALAANSFTLAAAFTVLSKGAQSTQLLEGLEAQGARTGRTLTNLSSTLEEITNNSISASEAMKLTSQGTSAGISSADLEKMTKVAYEASLALGRDVPDSLNRMVMAVTKLEPELVDELGLTVKITEASERYARQNNITVDSMTSVQKQQALLNAWTEQGISKYDGLAEAVNANPYNQLAATFDNLIKTGSKLINSVLEPLINLMSSNQGALLGAGVLFLSTIKGQIIPGLNSASEKSLELVKKNRESSVQELASQQKVSSGKRKAINEYIEAAKAGLATQEQFSAAIKESAAREKAINDKGYTDQTRKISALKKEKDTREKLESIQSKQKSITILEAQANGYLASEGVNVTNAKSKLSKTLKEVSNSFDVNYQSVRTSEKGLKGLGNQIAATGTGLKAAGKVAGVAFLNFLPVIGQVIAAVSVLWEFVGRPVFNKLTGRTEESIKAFEEFNKVIDSTAEKIAALEKIENSTGNAADRAIAIVRNQSATIYELSEAYLTLANAQKSASRLQEDSTVDKARLRLVEQINKAQKDGNLEEVKSLRKKQLLDLSVAPALDVKSLSAAQAFSDQTNSFFITDEVKGAAKYLDNLEQVSPKVAEGFYKMYGGAKLFSELPLEARLAAVAMAAEQLNTSSRKIEAAFNSLTSAVQGLNSGYTDFIKSLMPTTQFDTIVDKFNAINTAIRDTGKAIRSSPENANKLQDRLSEVLSGISGQSRNIFKLDLQESLGQFDDLQYKIEDLKKSQFGLNKNQKEYEQIDKEIATTTEKRQELIRRITPAIREQLKVYTNIVTKAQIDSITAQGNLAIAQAHLGVLQKRGVVTAADAVRVLKAENAVIALQQQEMQTQKLLLEIDLQKQRNKLEEIDKSIKLLKILKDISETEKERYVSSSLATKNMELQTLGAAKDPQSEARRKTLQGEVVELEKAQGLLDQREDTNNGILKSEAAIANVSKRVAAAGMAANSQAEIDAARSRKKLEIDSQRAAILREESVAMDSIGATTKEISSMIRMTNDDLEIQLLKINNTADQKKRALDEEHSQKLRALDIEEKLAKAQGLKDRVKHYEREREIELSRYATASRAVEVEKTRDTLQLVAIKNKIEELQLTREIYDIQQKSLDTVRELSDARLEESNTLRDLEAKRLGVSDSASLNTIKAIKAAEAAKKLANDEFKQKSLLIELEYDLLEAQRLLLIDQLTSRRNVIADEKAAINRSSQNEGKLDANGQIVVEANRSNPTDNQVDLFTSIINRLTSTSYSDARKNAQETLATKAFTANTADELAKTQGLRTEGGFVSQQARMELIAEEGLLQGSSSASIVADQFSVQFESIKASLEQLGPEGEIIVAVAQSALKLEKSFTDAFSIIGDATKSTELQLAAGFQAAAALIGAIQSILTAASNAKIANIDREIAAEERRDGKSAASVEKIKALEKKKEASARKAFNTNKKLMMAQAIMSTAAGVANALGQPGNPVRNAILAGIIGAMGAAQLAIIAGTSYESASAKTATVPTALSVGKRSDTVDLARGPNANAGGEVGFLRGSSGSGSNAGNYNTVGSAYGGELMRGYGNRGFVVGEKGPEIITPETPISVTPTNEMQSQQPLNATFNIQALDSSGVQDLLVAQKGNIIKMLREAANASGTSFMEEVNVNVYTRPNVAKL